MQRESVKQGKSARHWIVWLAVLIAAPATLLARMAVWQPEILPEQPAAHRLCDAPVFRAL